MDKNPDKWWIVKPSCSSQGKGIWFTKDYNQIAFKSNIIVSHYIDNPLLINGFKFDLRIYILVTSINPLVIYIYEEGLARFATQKFVALGQDTKSKFAHLTNFSINKKNINFVSNEDAQEDDKG